MFYLYHALQMIFWTFWFFLVQFVGEGRSQKWGFIWRFFIIGVFLRVLFKINNSPFPQIPGEEKPKLSWDTFSLILSLCHSVQVTFIAVMMMMNIKDIIIIITRPKPPSGRQGLVGSWGKDTVRQVHYKMFSTSHFAPTALSSNWILLCLNVVIKTHL